MFDKVVGHLAQEKATIAKAPGAFMVFLLAGGVLGFLVSVWYHKGRLDDLEQRIKLRDDQIASLKTKPTDVDITAAGILAPVTAVNPSAQATVAPSGDAGAPCRRISAAGHEWCMPSTDYVDWDEAKDVCPTLTVGGLHWKLPTEDEFYHLYKDERASKSLLIADGEYWAAPQGGLRLGYHFYLEGPYRVPLAASNIRHQRWVICNSP